MKFWILSYMCLSLCAGLDGASVSGASSVCGSGQLPMDGCLALSYDASFTHSHRPKHAVGSQGPLQGSTPTTMMHENRKLCYGLFMYAVVISSIKNKYLEKKVTATICIPSAYLMLQLK